MNPMVSVVMSVYNAELFLRESIESILNQSFKNFEFIIINDGSTDNSLDIIKSYRDERIILIDQKNSGLAKSLNNGIAVSKSAYIVRMDADDISLPQRLKKQLDFMLKNPSYALVGSNANLIDVKGKFLYTSNLATDTNSLKDRLPDVDIIHSATLFKKSAFYRAKQYPEEVFHHFEDKILFNKMAKHGDFCNLKEALIAYRLVPNSISNLDGKRIKKLKKISDQIILNDGIVTESDLDEIKEITNISINKKLATYHLAVGSIKLKNNCSLEATIHFIKSLYYYPYNITTYLKLLACSLPYNIIKKLSKKNR